MKISKDEIEVNDALIKHKNISENSRIFCDRIEYLHNRKKGIRIGDFFFDHHLMFYLKGKLVFKVWLRNNPEDKEYKDIYEALKDVGIKLIEK